MAQVSKLLLVAVGVGAAVVAWVMRKRAHAEKTFRLRPLVSRLRSCGF